MNVPDSPDAEKDWLDPVFILQTVFAHWKLLLAAPFLFGVLVALYTLTIPNTFESNTAIVVREPQIPVTGETSPLSIEMLQALVESAQVKHSAYKSLSDSGALPQEVEFRDFQRMLATKVDKKVGRDLALLPMIKLSAKAEKPELAAEIANRWADMATSQTNRIYSGDVELLSQFAAEIFSQSDKALRETEDRYTSMLLEANVMQTSNALQAQWAQHARAMADMLDLQAQIDSRTAVLTNVESRLEQQRIDGVWVGDIVAEALRTGQMDSLPEPSTLTAPIYRIVKDIERGEKALADFEIRSQVQYKDMLLRNKEKQLEQIAQEIVRSQDQLAKGETQYQALKEELAKIPEKLTLDKAITDDALWEAFLSGELAGKELVPLKTQESNPVFEQTKQAVVDLSGEIKGQQARVAYYQQRTEELKEEVSTLAEELSRLMNEKQSRTDTLVKDRELHQFFAKDFISLRQTRKTLINELNEMQAQLNSRQAEVKILSDAIRKNEALFFSNKAHLDALERDVENREQVRTSLASKAEEVQLLKVSAAQASRSGTAILYRAEANPIRISPKRTYTVLGAMAGCFFFLCFVLVLRAGPLAGLGKAS